MEDKKNIFRKTEGNLYRYFRDKKELQFIASRVEQLKSQIQQIEDDIKNTNVKIDYYQSGMAIGERVQTSSTGTSYAEAEIVKAIDRLEREHVLKTKQQLKLNAKIRDAEYFINYMEYNLSTINEECRRFIELKYGDKVTIPVIARKLNMAQATCYRLREEIVNNIAQFQKFNGKH